MCGPPVCLSALGGAGVAAARPVAGSWPMAGGSSDPNLIFTAGDVCTK